MAEINVLPAFEVDTTQPFESVKEAVHLFGEKADLKALKFPNAEKRASVELQQLRENLAATRSQLSQAQMARDELLHELTATRKLVETKAVELAKTFATVDLDSNTKHIEPKLAEAAKPENDNDSISSRMEVLQLDEKDLQVASTAKVFTPDVEIGSEVDSRDSFLRDSHEKTTSELDNFEGTVPARNGFSMNDAVSISTMETSQVVSRDRSISPDGDVIPEDISVPDVEKIAAPSEASGSGRNLWIRQADSEEMEDGSRAMVPVKDVEMLVALEQQKIQLREARKTQEKLALVVADSYSRLRDAKLELERARLSELKARQTEATSLEELTEMKTRLEVLLKEKSTLAAASETLREELSNVKMEISALMDRYEASPELQRAKAELAAVTEAESKAKETIAGVNIRLQAVSQEADKAKYEAEMALEAAHNAKVEAEQAKASLHTAESKLQAALREAQAAKASENMALAELKDLAEKAARKKSGEQRVLQNERKNLAKKLQEAEELAKMKIAAALAQVDAAKAREHEIMTKLEAARLEIEANRLLAKEALHRAETAEAAKSVIENELRRRRKAVDTTTGTHHHHQHHHHHNRDSSAFQTLTPDRRVEPPLSQNMPRRSLDYGYVSADVSTESIAELLQLKVGMPLKGVDEDAAPGSAGSSENDKMVKKKSFIPKLGSYLSRKKSPATRFL